MDYRGTIRNGHVILENAGGLPEGTSVRVEPITSTRSNRGSADAVVNAVRSWAGPTDELDRLLAEVQSLRDGDTAPHRDELE